MFGDINNVDDILGVTSDLKDARKLNKVLDGYNPTAYLYLTLPYYEDGERKTYRLPIPFTERIIGDLQEFEKEYTKKLRDLLPKND